MQLRIIKLIIKNLIAELRHLEANELKGERVENNNKKSWAVVFISFGDVGPSW